ncbi:hypothetical protein Pan110_32340 [Gimesia panareensis]|nr:hypothetical protein Pan110_32340 [Gimesia panareensis]
MTEENENLPVIKVNAKGGPYDGEHIRPAAPIDVIITDSNGFPVFADTVYRMVFRGNSKKFKGRSPAGQKSITENPESESNFYCYQVTENTVDEDGTVLITVEHLSEE